MLCITATVSAGQFCQDTPTVNRLCSKLIVVNQFLSLAQTQARTALFISGGELPTHVASASSEIARSPGPVPVILDTIAIPLEPCPDSMFAEIHAAEATLDKPLEHARQGQIEEVVMQGDCMNIVKLLLVAFAYTGRILYVN